MHVDGDFMDGQLGIDRKKMADRAKEHMKKKKDESDEPEKIDFDADDDSWLYESSFTASGEKGIDKSEVSQNEQTQNDNEEKVDFDNEEEEDDWANILEEDEQQEEVEFSTPPKVKHNKDYRVFPGGPYQSQINSWKKMYGDVFMFELGRQRYVWRTINRYEYKEIVAVANTDPLMREEMICETCVLFPESYTFEEMANGNGGVPAALSEAIMEKSGFTRNFDVKRL